jgi:uncharacterized membrane protein YbhN (UPF0104 family)
LVTDADAAARPDAADPPSGGLLRSRLFAAVRVAATVAIIVGLIIKLSPGDLRAAIRDCDPWMMTGAALMMFAVQALVTVKWFVLTRARDVQLPFVRIARAYCVGNLLTNVLPSAVGGDVYRVYRVQREAKARAADVTMSVLYERATGYGAMTCLGALGAAFHYGEAWAGLLAIAGGATLVLTVAFVLPRVPFPAVRGDHFLRNLLAHRREALAVYQMALLSLAIQALYISTIALAGRSLGVEVSWWYWAFITWVIAMALLAPITLGGLGVRESSFSALVKHGGGTAAQGASTGFALGLLLIVANAGGLLLIEVYERFVAREHAGERDALARDAARVTPRA